MIDFPKEDNQFLNDDNPSSTSTDVTGLPCKNKVLSLTDKPVTLEALGVIFLVGKIYLSNFDRPSIVEAEI